MRTPAHAVCVCVLMCVYVSVRLSACVCMCMCVHACVCMCVWLSEQVPTLEVASFQQVRATIKALLRCEKKDDSVGVKTVRKALKQQGFAASDQRVRYCLNKSRLNFGED